MRCPLYTVPLLLLSLFLLLAPSMIIVTAATNNSSWTAQGRPRPDTSRYWFIDNETRITNNTKFIDGNIVINSSGSIIVDIDGELVLRDVNLGFNNTGNGTPTIQVLPGGKLELDNLTTRILFSPTAELRYQIIVEPGAVLDMKKCDFILSSHFMKPAFRIESSIISIEDCEFFGGYTGLSLNNISNVTINNCSFMFNNYGIEIINSENIQIINSEFHDNSNASCNLINSGGGAAIKTINCTFIISQPAYKIITPPQLKIENEQFIFKLQASNLTVVNMNLSGPGFDKIENYIELDNSSEITFNWYLHLLTTTKKGEPIGSVKITIVDNTSAEVFSGETNESGGLAWIALKSMNVRSDEVIDHNPFKITASNENKKYSGSKYIILTAENSAIDQIINMTKKKEDKGTDIQDMLLMYCICIMVIISVFIILFSINIYLAKKKLGLDKFGNLLGVEGKRGAGGIVNSGLITCSECGTQVTEDAAFCPHCGELFEGDEFECSGCLTKLSAEADECPVCGKVFIDVLGTSAAADKKTGLKSQNGKDGRIEKTESMYCSECGAVVGKTEKRCPGCDLKFDDSKKNKKVDGDTKRARHAYKVTAHEEKKLKKTKQTLPETLSGSEDEDMYMCSMCGASVNEQAKTCPKCGTELE